MCVEVHVHRGDDLVVVGMLERVELLGEVVDVVVKDHRDGAHDLLVGRLPLLVDEGVAHQVAHRL